MARLDKLAAIIAEEYEDEIEVELDEKKTELRVRVKAVENGAVLVRVPGAAEKPQPTKAAAPTRPAPG